MVVSLWGCWLWPWTAKAHRLEERLCGIYRFTNCGIGYEFGECSNVLGNIFKISRFPLCPLNLTRDIRYNQSRYWGRQGRHLRLRWWFFQSKVRNELSGLVQLDRPLALSHFGNARGGDAKRLGDLMVLDPPLLKTVEQLPRC
jgi:hypothetical protein